MCVCVCVFERERERNEIEVVARVDSDTFLRLSACIVKGRARDKRCLRRHDRSACEGSDVDRVSLCSTTLRAELDRKRRREAFGRAGVVES